MVLLAEVIYSLFCVLFAYLNYKLISKNKRIYHGLNGLVHVILIGISYLIFGWFSILVLPFVARVVFDTALNHFRGLPLNYLPTDPKSIIDKLERKIFKISPHWIYLLLIVVINIIYFFL